MAVGPNALTSLASLKQWMGITSTVDDAVLEKAIDRATARIESYCARVFKARNIQEWRDGAPVSTIRLYQWPVLNVVNVWTGSYAALVIGAGDTTDLRASVSVCQDIAEPAVILTRTDITGVSATTTLDFGSFPETDAMNFNINATPGFTSALGKRMRCAQLRPRAGGDTISNPQTVTLYAADIASEYTYDGESGLLSVDRSAFEHWADGPGRFPMGARSVLVEYRAGYETIPDDLEQACNEVAAMMYRDRRRDSGLQSERLGDYNYTRATTVEMNETMLRLLADYREIA